MAYCPCCGAWVQEGDRVCSQCGTLVSLKSQHSHGEGPEDEQTVRAGAQPAAPQTVQQPVQPQQPAWAQYANQPQAQPTFYAEKRPLGKGGAITMIVIGAVLLAFFVIGMIAGFVQGSLSFSDPLELIGPVCVLFGGGLLLLLFGLRKMKNVNRYNASLNDPQ